MIEELPKNDSFVQKKMDEFVLQLAQNIGKKYCEFKTPRETAFSPEQLKYTPVQAKRKPPKRTFFSQFAKVTRYMAVLSVLRKSSVIITKRELFYKLKEVFSSYEEVSKTLKDLSNTLEVPRHFLRVVSTSKCLVFGQITISFIQTDMKVNLSSNSGGVSMNELGDFELVGHHSVKAILLIEKEATFSTLVGSLTSLNKDHCSLAVLSHVLVITGRGYGDHATKRTLKRLSSLLPSAPLFYLGDMDPYGVDIYLNYCFGSPDTPFECLETPQLQWKGVIFAKEDIGEVKLQPMTQNDLSKLTDITMKPFFDWKEMMKSFQKIDQIRADQLNRQESLFAKQNEDEDLGERDSFPSQRLLRDLVIRNLKKLEWVVDTMIQTEMKQSIEDALQSENDLVRLVYCFLAE